MHTLYHRCTIHLQIVKQLPTVIKLNGKEKIATIKLGLLKS